MQAAAISHCLPSPCLTLTPVQDAGITPTHSEDYLRELQESTINKITNAERRTKEHQEVKIPKVAVLSFASEFDRLLAHVTLTVCGGPERPDRPTESLMTLSGDYSLSVATQLVYPSPIAGHYALNNAVILVELHHIRLRGHACTPAPDGRRAQQQYNSPSEIRSLLLVVG